MKLVAILRIKDQMSTIDECLVKLSSIADEIVIVDNGSTDGTLEAYARYPKVVNVIRTVGFDEGRDKIMAHEGAKERNPDWIIWTDADEIFEDHFTRESIESYMGSSYNRITFRMCNFWLSKMRFRYDREYYLYTLHPQRSMWRNLPGAYFRNLKIHNGDIMGVPGRVFLSPYRLKHYGYVERKKIEEKLKNYFEVDKSGNRDYVNTIDLDATYKTMKFMEFENRYANYAYILAYKHVCNLLWLIERARRKIQKFL